MMRAPLLSLLILLCATHAGALSIVDSKHNLSVSGPGVWKSLVEEEVCVFCHTPHRASDYGVLWNRNASTTTYVTYNSSTIQTLPGQPTGSSKLCLSCHDGTIALGEVLNRPTPIAFPSGKEFLTSGPAYIGSDLSNDHPVSIPYPLLPEFHPVGLVDLPLDKDGLMQCTTCHDPHDSQWGKFLRKANTASALCTTCHDRTGWQTATHATSPLTWDSVPPDPWPNSSESTVAANGCGNCHSPHNAGSSERLLRSAEEDGCTVCHNGHVAFENIEAEFQKSYHHPIEATVGVHDPAEDPLLAPRHVECPDCHNPHQANASTAIAPNAPGRLAGVDGFTLGGTRVDPADFLYEVCFRCHGDSATATAPVARVILQTNTRLEFDVNNPSYHPVAGPGANPNVPSLLSPLTTSSIIFCTDCHNNDSGPGAGGSGPEGPHGSSNHFLLERRYNMIDGIPEDPVLYALCYKCHSQDSIRQNDSFKEHDKHIRGEDTPCSVCHDPHGVSFTQGTATNNAHLINFDTTVVSASPSGPPTPTFEDLGTFSGRCYLVCHGQDHNPFTYP